MKGLSTRCRCLVWGMMGKKMSSDKRVSPPEERAAGACVRDEERGQISDHENEDEQGDEAGFPGEACSPSHLGRTRNRRTNRPTMPTAQAGQRQRRSRNRSGRWSRWGRGKPRPKAPAQWLSVTSAKAQKAQKTKACARPGSGRSRMTLAWKRTSQTKSRTRLPIGKRWKLGSFFDLRILSRTTPKRRQKAQAEADDQPREEQFLRKREVLRLSEGWERNEHKEATENYSLTIQDGPKGCRAVSEQRISEVSEARPRAPSGLNLHPVLICTRS